MTAEFSTIFDILHRRLKQIFSIKAIRIIVLK